MPIAYSRRAGGSYTWVFNHPDDVRRILITNHRNYAKGVGFDRIKILLGNGIIVSEGEFWKRQRRLMQPTFHRRILAQLGGIIARANDRVPGALGAKAASGEPVNVTDDMSEHDPGDHPAHDLRRRRGRDDRRRPARTPSPSLTEESARDLKFAYRFRKLTTLIGKFVARRRAAGGSLPASDSDYLSMMLMARDKETRRRHERQGAHRRDHDADRGRP